MLFYNQYISSNNQKHSYDSNIIQIYHYINNFNDLNNFYNLVSDIYIHWFAFDDKSEFIRELLIMLLNYWLRDIYNDLVYLYTLYWSTKLQNCKS